MASFKNILIAGLGISGYEAALLALHNNISVTVIDTQSSPVLIERRQSLEQLGATVHLQIDLKNFTLQNQPDCIVISPGIDPVSPFGDLLKKISPEIISELEFAALFIKSPLLGITGTNGKTTTVELVTHCLNQLGKKAIAAGNIGYALCKVAIEAKQFDYIVVEVSSFQLEAIDQIHFQAAALLNISSDHIDRYPTYEEYGNTKIKLLNHADFSTVSTSVIEDGWKIPQKNLKTISLNNRNADIYLYNGNIHCENHTFPYPSANLQGKHNAENLMATISLLSCCGFSPKDIYYASLSYKTAPHRMQFFLHHQGVDFYNDSKATNPHAMNIALESLGTTSPKNIRLIAGGKDKKMDFNIANRAIASYVIKIYIYGECSSTLFKAWNGITHCIEFKSFQEAVKQALAEVSEGETLLLSPGCSSLDSFKNYEERGNQFIKIIQEWTKNEK